MSKIISTVDHYEKLIEDGNDPVHDNDLLKEHLNKWTGDNFLDLLDINKELKVLEIGVGTGRLAKRVLETGCYSYVGLDVSGLTVKRARENLMNFSNVEIIKKNILDYNGKEEFDLAFSVLTFQHIKDKRKALEKMLEALKTHGKIVLSLDNIKDKYLDYGPHKTEVYFNDIKKIIQYLKELNCNIEDVIELKEDGDIRATIIKCCK